MECIYENEKCLIINNSKATNITSTLNSVECNNNIFLIIGGRIKNKDFSSLNKYKKKIKKCFVIGESTDLIFKKVYKYFNTIKCFTLESAIDSIFNDLISLDYKVTILFSPASSSFDQFKNFEERGNIFNKIIMKRINKI